MTKTADKNTQQAANPPVAKLRLGLTTANIWHHRNGENSTYSVNFQRRYRDRQDQWHSSNSFFQDDLLVLAKLADMAHDEITRLLNVGE